MGNKHIGSSFDDFLRSQGMLEEVKAVARRRVEEWQSKHSHPRAKGSENAGSVRRSNHQAVEQNAAE
jgi:hypothetical protein